MHSPHGGWGDDDCFTIVDCYRIAAPVWGDIAIESRRRGGLFVGGPERCIWTASVLPCIAGYFHGYRMQTCSGYHAVYNTRALRVDWMYSSPPNYNILLWLLHAIVPTLARCIQEAADTTTSSDDMWFVDKVEAGVCGCQRVINGMADRLDAHLFDRCLSYPCCVYPFLFSISQCLSHLLSA